jgi:hypothetical protein
MKNVIAISEAWSEENNGLRLEALLKKYELHLQDVIRRNEKVSLKTFPRYMNQKEVIGYLGHEKTFRILVNEYGLKPIRQEHKCNIYSSKQVEELCIQFDHNL